MVDPHGVKVPKFDFPADSFNPAQESMQHVSEHVAAVEGDDGMRFVKPRRMFTHINQKRRWVQNINTSVPNTDASKPSPATSRTPQTG